MSHDRKQALSWAVYWILALSGAGTALAQQQPADRAPLQNAPPKENAQSTQAAPKAPPEAKTAAGSSGTSAIVMDLSAVDGLIGRSVKSSAGEDMGRIVDLLVTPAGQIRAAVIDFGGILGVGSRKVAVDWKTLNFSNITKNGTVDLALSRNEVRVAPEYKSGDPIVILEAPKAIKTTPSDAKNPKEGAEQPASSSASPAGDAKASSSSPGR